MKTALCLTALSLVLAAPALAVEQPKAGRHDGRIRYINYDPDQVIQIWTAPGAVMEIQFAEGESVPEGNVAATDGSRLERKPRGNFLYLKAKGCLDPEPLLVTTKTPSGQLRPYRFEVSTRGSDCSEPASTQPNPAISRASAVDGAPKPPHQGNLRYVPDGGLTAAADVMYAVVIRYPDDEAAKRRAAARAREAEQQRQHAARLLKQQVSWPYGNKFDGTWNYRYVAHGNLMPPSEVRDNGYETVFLFPQMERVPSLYRWNPGADHCNRGHDDHNESTVNPSVHRSGSDGDTIIASGTAQGWCLRDGQTVLEIRNFGYTAGGATPATGTVSPYVMRALKGNTDPDDTTGQHPVPHTEATSIGPALAGPISTPQASSANDTPAPEPPPQPLAVRVRGAQTDGR